MIFELALSSVSQATWEKLYQDFTSHLFGRYTDLDRLGQNTTIVLELM